MSESIHEVTEEVADETPAEMSFQESVWRILSNIDMSEYVSKKVVKVKGRDGRADYEFSLDYISWVNAWQKLMEFYPESSFEFDEIGMLPNGGGGEQWITLTVKQGEQEMVRRWWLPIMDMKNQPVSNPSSTQVNNTRMRVLVKCIAMCGLGIEIYGGEDVSDGNQDAEPVTSVRKSTSVRAEIIDEMNLTDAQWATVDEWASKVRELVPTKDIADLDALEPVYKDIAGLGELAVAVSHKLESFQRSALSQVRRKLAKAE